MTDKKPSTAEIMAMLRKKSAEGASAPPPAPATEASAVPAAASAPAEPAVTPATPAAKPKGTADIMAAIRAKGAIAPVAAAPPAPAAGTPASGTPAAKPKGTSDIMAAIRAKGAAAAGVAPAAASVAVAVAPKVAAPASAGKSPAEMIQAMRAGSAVVTESAKPKFPPKSAAAGKKQELPRRSFPAVFFELICTPYYMAWTLMSAIGGLWGLGIARFMMPNTVLELPSKFKIGSLGDFPLGTVSEKFKASRGVWIVHTDSYDGQNVVYALSSVCTHLGCTPSWLDAEQKYKCPCHGSGFYINGINFEGPAPRPLERVGLVLGADGLLEVDKSLKFQEELGQWTDPKSFVRVG